jgi:hypothetical protein
VGLSLLATVCTCGRGKPTTLAPLTIAQINPAPIWQLWGQRALDCARSLKEHAGDSVHYRMVHDSVDVTQFVWIVVASEQPDGGFPCRTSASDSLGSCAGQFRGPDSILISGQRLGYQPVIAHEILHWAVESDRENEWRHGPPWGLCEYF